MAGKLERWFNDNIWEVSNRSFGDGVDGLPTINGTILQSILGGDGLTDERVSIREGLRIAEVYICTTVRGYTMASLPCNVLRSENGKTEKLTDHPAYWLLSQEPNQYMSAANFHLTLMLHVDGWGNGYAHINRDSRRNPSSFDIMEPWKVTITKEDGFLWYNYEGETYPARDVLHYRINSLDGIEGLSPILENQDTMGMAKKLKRYASLVLGAQPPGVLSYEGNLTPEQRSENEKAWRGGSKGSVKVLSGKWKYEPIMTPGDEVQFTQAKESNNRDIDGIYKVPPTFAQNFQRATFSNAEQSDLVYAKHTVTPICTVFEKENNMKLFFEKEKRNTYTKYNLNGLLRGDMAARQGFYQAMINTGVMKRNEARDLEDMNPYDGGDVPVIQGAMIPADKEGIEALRKNMETKVIPSAGQPNGKHMNGHSILN